jgi:alanine racemase
MTAPRARASDEGTSASGERATRELNAWVEVDFSALGRNLPVLRQAVGAGVEIIAVVKANAYGHGAAPVALELERLGVERLATFSTAEAVALREAGVRQPLIVLGHSFPGDAAPAAAHAITLTVDGAPLAEALAAEGRRRGAPSRIHIKVDTGLHRFGLAPDDAVALAERLRGLDGIEVEGLWTHMANADEADDSFSERQWDAFAKVANRLDWIPYRHASNSATALRRPELRLDGVRLGLSLYGISPSEFVPTPELEPVLSLKARIARLVRLEPGEGVSYGLTWRAKRPSLVALVPVGYGDGWRRNLGNRGSVLVGGRRCPMVGRVMMDGFIADVTDVPGVAVSDEVVLLGRQGNEAIGPAEVARLVDTISWDVLASLQARLPRVYRSGGVSG